MLELKIDKVATQATEDIDGIIKADNGNAAFAPRLVRSMLKVTDKGAIIPGNVNLEIILNNDVNVKGLFCFDAFTLDVLILDGWCGEHEGTRPLDQRALTQLATYLEREYGLYQFQKKTGEAQLKGVLNVLARNNVIHSLYDNVLMQLPKWGSPELEPIKEEFKRFSGKSWEDIGGAKGFPCWYWTADPTNLNLAVSFNTFCAMYAKMKSAKQTALATKGRDIKPINYQLTPIIRGEGGSGKSSIFTGILPEAYVNADIDLSKLDSRDMLFATKGKAICEIGELVNLDKASLERLKIIFGDTKLSTTLKHSNDVIEIPNQRVCFCTTNHNYLKILDDESGTRRYCVLESKGSTSEGLRKAVWLNEGSGTEIWKLFWAEVIHEVEDNNYNFKVTSEIIEEARIQNMQYVGVDSRLEGIINSFLNMYAPVEWKEMDLRARAAYQYMEYHCTRLGRWQPGFTFEIKGFGEVHVSNNTMLEYWGHTSPKQILNDLRYVDTSNEYDFADLIDSSYRKGFSKASMVSLEYYANHMGDRNWQLEKSIKKALLNLGFKPDATRTRFSDCPQGIPLIPYTNNFTKWHKAP